jgi:transcriptional regulator with XRE-family HTH domain
VPTSSTGPLIPRRRLGSAFKELREAAGETLQQTARTLMFSPSKLSRIENGLAGEPHPRDVRDLIAHFGVQDSSDLAALEELAAAGRQPGWWQVPPYEMPSRLDTFISYESAASRIEAYVAAVLPAMLQTRAYAAECIRRLAPHLSAEEVAQQVELRLSRQRHLREGPDRPTQLHAFPETVLRRVVGNSRIMDAQLGAVLDSFGDPMFDIHVMPFSAGIYEAIDVSNLTIFSFSTAGDPDIAALERVKHIQFMDRPDSVQKYRDVVRDLSNYWLDRTESQAFIEGLRKMIRTENR